VVLKLERIYPTSGSYLEIPLRKGSGVELWANGRLGLRTEVSSGEMSSGAFTTTANFVAAPDVRRFTVEVPRLAVYQQGGAVDRTPQMIEGPWVIPVQIPK